MKLNIQSRLIFKNGGEESGKGCRCRTAFLENIEEERSWSSKFVPVEMELILSPSSILAICFISFPPCSYSDSRNVTGLPISNLDTI
ncbi:unnamed protein product [Moneuplotes crassus]|uniref:Uncharacterized protein n=1 Tax=Euplotes crassus TaxID=5936 RepID=A0AAD2D5F9_EUPCR|nr:unnamed protein product [Moneuplotes crassus]